MVGDEAVFKKRFEKLFGNIEKLEEAKELMKK